ncbi:MAG: galactose-1-phosphate uridylyltransferase [Streptosporangiaceae bacterium]
MRKTAMRLSDGRELIYFDATTRPGRDAADRRRLPPAEADCQLRYDPLLRTSVMYAAHRQDRSYLPPAADCPLCPSTGGRLTEIPASDYEVVVFENRYPALADSRGRGPASQGGELPPVRPSAGRCEVICFTSDHDASFADLSADQVSLVTEALIDRTAELTALPGVAQVYCFENRGREIGVTQPHPHGQIYAYPFVTPRTGRMLQSARAYTRRTGRNLFDDVVAAERAADSRVVRAGRHWIAFVPHAARWPYELHCYPLRRVPDLASLLPAERAELADFQLDLLGRFARLFANPAPYVCGWHQAPAQSGRRDFALHLELFTFRRSDDKLKYLAGSESGMDAFASDVLPEQAAARLRALG